MLIRRVDNGDVSLLKSGSHKEIIFNCDICGIEVQQQYRIYLKQNDGHFCRPCRNRHTANREDVKEKQSISSKLRWADNEYRESMSEKISSATKKSWSGNIERKLNLSINNPMKNEDTRLKKSISSSTKENDIINALKDADYEYIEKSGNIKGENFKVRYICNNGHDRWQIWNDFKQGHRCYECSMSISNAEKEILEYIQTFNLSIICNDRKIIRPLELDIVIPDKKIAIEYCGLYWHGNLKKPDKKYHLKKLELCNEQGYRLITIFEDEWLFKNDIVKDRLLWRV